MTFEDAEAIRDPIGVVVRMVAAAESTLDAGVVQEVVTRVAGGRAKRRRLASGLLARPGVLGDGRSPAPRVIGDLLLALREAGAQTIAAPCCADCGTRLHPATPRPGLVLRGLRSHPTAVLGLRPATRHHQPRPAGTTTLRPVPRPRRP